MVFFKYVKNVKIRILEHWLKDCASDIVIKCNVNKTVRMVFHPKDKRKIKIVSTVFPCLKLNNAELKYVDEFKYLGYVIRNDERYDEDILREVRGLFSRANVIS